MSDEKVHLPSDADLRRDWSREEKIEQLVRMFNLGLAAGGLTAEVADLPSKPTKKVKPPSRAQRWEQACEEAAKHLDAAVDALEGLVGVQTEYQDWWDNLPENLQGSVLGEKLQEVADLDLEGIASSLENAKSEIEEAGGLDLPQGFGRD